MPKRFFSRCLTMLAILLALNACGEDEFRASVIPAGGTLSIDGATAFPVGFPIAFFNRTNNGATFAVTLTGSYPNAAGNVVNTTVTLNIPNNNVFFQNIDMKDSGSTLIETGGTTFTSTKLTGTVNLTSISNTTIQGTFSIVFTDATNKTRRIEQGNFVLNSFGFNA